MAGTGPTLISSVQRAVRLLDEVGGASGPVSAKVLASRAGLPLPTTYHLLRTLVYEGYLERLDDGYVLGSRFDALVDRQIGQLIPTRARPILRALHDTLGMATYLGFFDEDSGEIGVTDVIDSPRSPRVEQSVPMHEGAHATALGKVILGALPASQRDEYIATHPLVDLTAHTVTDMQMLRERIGPGGQTLDREEYCLGVACMANSLEVGRRVGAVCVSFPMRRLPTASNPGSTDALAQAARRLGLALSV
jgi:IclR family transcriptional regulator, acetate operon repressor